MAKATNITKVLRNIYIYIYIYIYSDTSRCEINSFWRGFPILEFSYYGTRFTL